MDRNADSNQGRATHGAPNAQTTAADRLRHAVSASAMGAGSREELQAAARALVAELRGRQDAPEQVLIQMKALLAEAGLRTGFPAAKPDEAHGNSASLYRDIITWSIRYYYENPES
jgi:hypothetical protein